MRPLTLLVLAGLAAPAALAQTPVGDQIRALPDALAGEWESGLQRILLAQYDADRSRSLDTPAEVDAVACDVWAAMDAHASLGALAQYGIAPGRAWLGGLIGFDEPMRAHAAAAGTRCLDTDETSDAGHAAPVHDPKP